MELVCWLLIYLRILHSLHCSSKYRSWEMCFSFETMMLLVGDVIIYSFRTEFFMCPLGNPFFVPRFALRVSTLPQSSDNPIILLCLSINFFTFPAFLYSDSENSTLKNAWARQKAFVCFRLRTSCWIAYHPTCKDFGIFFKRISFSTGCCYKCIEAILALKI